MAQLTKELKEYEDLRALKEKIANFMVCFHEICSSIDDNISTEAVGRTWNCGSGKDGRRSNALPLARSLFNTNTQAHVPAFGSFGAFQGASIRMCYPFVLHGVVHLIP